MKMFDRRTDKAVLFFALLVGVLSSVGGYFIWYALVPAILAGITMFLLILVVYHYAGWGVKWRGMVFGIFGPEKEDEPYYDYLEKHVEHNQRGKR